MIFLQKKTQEQIQVLNQIQIIISADINPQEGVVNLNFIQVKNLNISQVQAQLTTKIQRIIQPKGRKIQIIKIQMLITNKLYYIQISPKKTGKKNLIKFRICQKQPKYPMNISEVLAKVHLIIKTKIKMKEIIPLLNILKI